MIYLLGRGYPFNFGPVSCGWVPTGGNMKSLSLGKGNFSNSSSVNDPS